MTAIYYTYSGNDYTAGTAGATDFPLVSSAAKTISYLQPSHIHVYTSTNQGASWTELTRPAQWDFASSGTVARLSAGIASGTWVRVRRITPNDGSYVTFQSGSLLTAEQLNSEASSNAYVNQETNDLLATTLSEVQAAQQSIESAIAVIGGLAAFTQVANVAAIPASPSNGAAVEVVNSTGIESFSPLTGVPAGFIGDSGLTARIIYSSGAASWTWFGYGVKEPDSRYLKQTGGTLTGQLRGDDSTSAAMPGYAFDGDADTGVGRLGANELALITGGVARLTLDSAGNGAFTGPVTLPNGSTVAGYQTVAGMSSYLTSAAASAAYAPLISPTFTGQPYVNGSYRGNVTAVAALDIDCSLGNTFTKTINANSTFTVSNVPASRSYAFTLELTHTSGTVTWFSGVVWPGGTAPTLTTGKVHLFMFFTDDGGTAWRASSLINY